MFFVSINGLISVTSIYFSLIFSPSRIKYVFKTLLATESPHSHKNTHSTLCGDGKYLRLRTNAVKWKLSNSPRDYSISKVDANKKNDSTTAQKLAFCFIKLCTKFKTIHAKNQTANKVGAKGVGYHWAAANLLYQRNQYGNRL